MTEAVITIEDFNLTAAHKEAPALGMEGYHFYYGCIDGIEIGGPCDSEESSIEGLKSLLDGCSPYCLKCYLSEDVDWYQNALGVSVCVEQKSLLREGLKQRQALYEKVKAYRSTAGTSCDCPPA
ncbi:hypothetical protein [Vibrio barjaei]|uniref:hypothetical protein n=1 Tax=Vibrio barjaei TaxID=1676683 RepID=UPI0022840E3A|nr:hypothetical protein [Vibrio barjaei]MCY9874047.1 hypothetical protein [Vibrio barjaei]